jgi:hypothetical protein
MLHTESECTYCGRLVDERYLLPVDDTAYVEDAQACPDCRSHDDRVAEDVLMVYRRGYEAGMKEAARITRELNTAMGIVVEDGRVILRR